MDVGIRTLSEQDINTLATSKQVEYGATGVTADGRRFRYVSFGGTSTVAPGLILTAPATTANYLGLTITATGTGGQVSGNLSSGATQIVLTNGSTAITADQFAEGTLDLIVGGASSDTGHYTLKVRGNSAAATSATFTVYLSEALRNTTALVPGTDTANLIASPFSAVVTSTTAALAVGLTVLPVPNTSSVTNYGWVQTSGPALVLNDAGGTITVGGGFAQSVTTAGNVVASSASTAPILGVTRKAISASTAGPVYLNIVS